MYAYNLIHNRNKSRNRIFNKKEIYPRPITINLYGNAYIFYLTGELISLHLLRYKTFAVKESFRGKGHRLRHPFDSPAMNLTPIRASLSSKEEPCPLSPHRGFLTPCPYPSDAISTREKSKLNISYIDNARSRKFSGRSQ